MICSVTLIKSIISKDLIHIFMKLCREEPTTGHIDVEVYFFDVSECVWQQRWCFWARRFPVVPLLAHTCIELPEESDQFRFLRASCFVNLKGAVGLIMAKASAMRISIPLDLSSRPCVPLRLFIRSCRPTPPLAPSLVFFPPCST